MKWVQSNITQFIFFKINITNRKWFQIPERQSTYFFGWGNNNLSVYAYWSHFSSVGSSGSYSFVGLSVYLLIHQASSNKHQVHPTSKTLHTLVNYMFCSNGLCHFRQGIHESPEEKHIWLVHRKRTARFLWRYTEHAWNDLERI